MFKLKEINGKVYCNIDGILKYIFERNKNINGHWEAFEVQKGEAFGKPVDSDKYRYDLAERLDVRGL